MRLRFKPTHVVLAMLCLMYFITYVDRVNIGTAAGNWYLPFLMSMELLLVGGLSAFLMHPEIPFKENEVMPSIRPAPAE
jgi:hypothetical protein